ncbi:MAG: porin [Proteobacteria bacterium]|nr:porin [Pseudomonadota bacterium]
MKKLLLATTALALSAGLAHAQGVTINGNGRMGLIHTRAGGVSTTVMENRLRLQFNVAIEADHGLTFGAFARTQSGSNGGAAFAGVISGSRIWVESNGLRLTFGNQDGAIQSRLVGAQTVGYTGGTFAGSSAGMFIFPQGQTSNGAGPNQRVAVQYQANGYYVHVSHDRAWGGANAGTEIAVGGTFGQFSVMVGHANATGPLYLAGTSMTTVAGAYNGGSWGLSAIVARRENVGTNWIIGGNVALGGGTLNGYVGRYVDGVVATNDNTYGLGYSYGLGGGARVAAGIERTNDVTRAEVGVAFNF